MKQHQLPLLLAVAAGLASILVPISARAATAFPLYVSNNSGTFGNTIVQFTSGGAGSSFASTGLSGPEGLAFDSAGNLYAANVGGSLIEKFSPTGVDLGVFAFVPNPVGLAFDTAGNLYAASFTNNKIEKFSPTGVDLGSFASTGLNQPTGLAFDAAGTTLYAANNGGGTFGSGTIVKFTLAGGSSTPFASGLDGPFGLAFDTAGFLYVANDLSNIIQKFTPLGVGTTFASTGLSTPVGLAFDSAGNLYAANQSSNTIEKFTSTGTDLGPFASSGLSSPTFIAFQPVVPEPSTWVMLGIPALLAAARRQRQSRNNQ